MYLECSKSHLVLIKKSISSQELFCVLIIAQPDVMSYSFLTVQLPSKPSSQPGASDRKSHHTSQLNKRYSHDEMLLLPQLGVSASPCGLLDDSLCSTSDTLASHRHWRIPKVHTPRSYTKTYTKHLQSFDCVLLISASQTSSGFCRDQVRVLATLDHLIPQCIKCF